MADSLDKGSKVKLIKLQGAIVPVKSTTHAIGETVRYLEPDSVIEVYTLLVGEFYELVDGSVSSI